MKISFSNLHPALNDSDNILLAKILARLELNAQADPEAPSSNVSVTNTPLPVQFNSAQNVAVTNTPTVNANITNGSIAVTSAGEFETLDHAHEKVHAGESFSLAEIASVANGATRYWMVSTPAAPTIIHMTWMVLGTVAYTFQVYETPTSPVGGAAWTPVARNRHNSVPNVLTALAGLTVSAPGTFLTGHRNSGGPNSFSAPVRSEDEWILAHSTNYLFALTANSAGGFFTLKLNWYTD